MALPPEADATPPRQTPQAAEGRPVGVARPRYGGAAPRLLANGYLPLPLVPGEKRPAITDWSRLTIDTAVVGGWAVRYPGHGVGLRTGTLVGIDIDVLDPGSAPGTGTPEAGGLTSRELLGVLRGLRGLDLAAADLVEVAPAYDHAEVTSMAASHVIYELVSLLAAKRADAAR